LTERDALTELGSGLGVGIWVLGWGVGWLRRCRNAQTRSLSHPLPVLRAREIDRWAQSTQYKGLLVKNRRRAAASQQQQDISVFVH
jgi:hypothetical protein